MNPYLEIREKYGAPGGMSWEELVGFHLANPDCYLSKGPNFFAMGRPVQRVAGKEAILDLTYSFDPALCDTWFLYAFAGDLAVALGHLPFDLPWMAWDRFGDDGEMRFLPLSSVKRLSGLQGFRPILDRQTPTPH